MGLLKLVICAAMLGCSQAFVAPASSLVVRPRADAVSANMLFGTKKPTITKGKVVSTKKVAKKVAKKAAKKAVKKATPGRLKTSTPDVNIGFQQSLPFPLGQIVEAVEVLRSLPGK